ncbi:P1 family peptidase [Halobacillus litoralis]|uniref:Peptidase n=1 Tax=Halobacillus litoralis TaxID=45668 RepID=A0A410M768_9BACI|nr:P1 family peptidase [Halobacillus litoralis]QAS50855.1 peptidase [Halobacillus litoralis]
MKSIHINDINGFSIGQKEDPEGHTGCTVILCENGAVAGVDVRGGAPGTRETDLLQSENLVQEVHGIFLAGGSAFGLDVGSGVMKFLEENDVGFDVRVTRVPIVPGAILFDLIEGRANIRPDKEMGYRASEIAWKIPGFKAGNYGAGAGAAVGKALGRKHSMKGGIGSCAYSVGDLKVGAVVAVNCFGDVVDPNTGEVIAGLQNAGRFLNTEEQIINRIDQSQTNRFRENTTIGAVLTNAKLHKSEANKLSSIAHDGLARTIRPSHTFIDGDTLFTLATGGVECDLNALSALANKVVEKAVINAVKSAASQNDLVSASDILKKR